VTPESIADLERGLEALAAAGLKRSRRTLETAQGARVIVDGREVVSFASNDYLGLARHPDVVAAVRDGVLRWGAGAGASHLVCAKLRTRRSRRSLARSCVRRPAPRR